MDVIVYVAHSLPGGIDGMDSTQKGGIEQFASYEPITQKAFPNLPWCKVTPVIVNTAKAVKEALNKLTPTERLLLGLR